MSKNPQWKWSNIDCWLYQILVVLTLGFALVLRIIITRGILVAQNEFNKEKKDDE
jgi:hypothetical protein